MGVLTREVVLITTCDLCGTRTGEDYAKVHTISFDGADYELDSCGDHELRRFTLQHLLEVARKVKNKPKASGLRKLPSKKSGGKDSRNAATDTLYEPFHIGGEIYKCPVCPNEECKSRAGLGRHFRAVHGQGIRDWAADQSSTDPQ